MSINKKTIGFNSLYLMGFPVFSFHLFPPARNVLVYSWSGMKDMKNNQPKAENNRLKHVDPVMIQGISYNLPQRCKSRGLPASGVDASDPRRQG